MFWEDQSSVAISLYLKIAVYLNQIQKIWGSQTHSPVTPTPMDLLGNKQTLNLAFRELVSKLFSAFAFVVVLLTKSLCHRSLPNGKRCFNGVALRKYA